MYVCRLGVICSLLSDTLVSGFTAGAAIHVFTSQIKDIFGFQVASYSGLFQNVYVSGIHSDEKCTDNPTSTNDQFFFMFLQTYIDILKNITTINLAATIVSVITIFILVVNNSFLKVSKFLLRVTDSRFEILLIYLFYHVMLCSFLSKLRTTLLCAYTVASIVYFPHNGLLLYLLVDADKTNR